MEPKLLMVAPLITTFQPGNGGGVALPLRLVIFLKFSPVDVAVMVVLTLTGAANVPKPENASTR